MTLPSTDGNKIGEITMLNNKILRVLSLLCVVACLMSLFGCSKEKPNDAIVTFPEDVSAIADFKCVCSTDHETEFVIENDNWVMSRVCQLYLKFS